MVKFVTDWTGPLSSFYPLRDPQMDPSSSRPVHRGSQADLVSLRSQVPLSKCLLNDTFAHVLVTFKQYGDLEVRQIHLWQDSKLD